MNEFTVSRQWPERPVEWRSSRAVEAHKAIERGEIVQWPIGDDNANSLRTMFHYAAKRHGYRVRTRIIDGSMYVQRKS